MAEASIPPDGSDKAIAAHSAPPVLRLRFDETEGEAHSPLDEVITEVESLSMGIDTMIRRATASSVAPGESSRSPANAEAFSESDDESDDAEEEPMMTMFDEEQPADIHAIDRMLAARADRQMAMPATESNEAMAPTDLDQAIDGSCEDISMLLTDTEPLDREAMDSHVPVADASALQVEQSPAPEQVDKEPGSIHAAVPALSLEPTQARGIIEALAAASLPNQHPSTQPARNDQHRAPTLEPAACALPAVPSVAMARSGNSLPASVVRVRGPKLNDRMLAIVSMTNLPMRYLPRSTMPMVNALAISLAFWALALVAVGPKLAAAGSTTSANPEAHETASNHTASSDGGHQSPKPKPHAGHAGHAGH